jgi:hypothetical protein
VTALGIAIFLTSLLSSALASSVPSRVLWAFYGVVVAVIGNGKIAEVRRSPCVQPSSRSGERDGQHLVRVLRAYVWQIMHSVKWFLISLGVGVTLMDTVVVIVRALERSDWSHAIANGAILASAGGLLRIFGDDVLSNTDLIDSR